MNREDLVQQFLDIIVNDDALVEASHNFAVYKLMLKYGESVDITNEKFEDEYYSIVSRHQRSILLDVIKVL